ncbi:MAG: AraC family transcriptional regulator [Pseudomonas sp.]|uniref:helix-turn-helix domain-containing protein n=1 Tax=Pseudomonas sp. TaxID=306 RepID=UPI0030EFB9AE
MASFQWTARRAPAPDSDGEILVTGGLTPWRERLAKNLIHTLLGEKISVPQLAQACALSRSHFSRAFKRSTGMSPQDWIHRQRIAQAKRLIQESDMTLTQISAECGFCDQAHFSRTFTRAEGMNPMEWRNRSAPGENA